jgi:predicted  nucleic acid-binding Zn-ribbon protein
VVIAVLMNSAGKEKYIQLIMAMEEGVQNTFVEIIQNSLDQQIFPSQQGSSLFRLEEEIAEVRKENTQLRGELTEITKKHKSLQREVNDLRDRLFAYEEEEEKGKATDYSVNSDGLQSQLEQQRVLIDNLKIKLISTVRENEL